jgi:RsiW-degrading membrane proteinase PrsW (M82 family)
VRRAEPPPGEFGIAPAHEIAPMPVPLAVRNALAEAAAREQPKPAFDVPSASDGKRKPNTSTAAPLTPPAHNYRYFVFLLALMPLCWMLVAPAIFGSDDEYVISQVEEGELPDDEALAAGETPEVLAPEDLADIESFDVEELVDMYLQNGKLPGAHLSSDSWLHWLYAILAAGTFLGLMLYCLPLGNATPTQLIVIGVVTATGGLIFLFGIQFLGAIAWALPLGGNIIMLIFVGIFRLLGFAYYAATLDDGPFLLLFFGFTFGVGLCEEFTKSLPVLFRGRDGQESDWRGAGGRGFASGVGFGVAEGIIYSSGEYNGIAPFSTYLVRFASCVTLHAVWTYAVGIMIWRYRQELAEEEDWRYLSLTLLKVLAVPMTLHGLYNTALTKELPSLALVAALASFGWLALQIELVMRRERNFYADLNQRRARRTLA